MHGFDTKGLIPSPRVNSFNRTPSIHGAADNQSVFYDQVVVFLSGEEWGSELSRFSELIAEVTDIQCDIIRMVLHSTWSQISVLSYEI